MTLSEGLKGVEGMGYLTVVKLNEHIFVLEQKMDGTELQDFINTVDADVFHKLEVLSRTAESV